MKYIIAIIQPDRIDEVVEALTEAEINLMTVSDVMGRGRQKGVAEIYRSHVEPGNLLRKVKIEVAVCYRPGRPHRQHRRWQDLRVGYAGLRTHPHR
jgi:nitrogen regulatory protein PII